MSLGRVVLLLLLLALAVGAGAVLLVEGNTTPVSLHLGSFAALTETSLWLVIALAFLGGAIAPVLLAGLIWLIGPFFKILIGTLFVLTLCAAAAIVGVRSSAGLALLVGLLLLLFAVTWECRADLVAGATAVRTSVLTSWNGVWAALGAIQVELTAWVRGFAANPPAVAAPPPSVLALLILLLVATVLLGSTILLRSGLILAFGAAGVVAALRAMALVRVGTPIELRARSGGLGGSQGGWRLSQPASLLVIATILLGAAVGLAQVDRGPEQRRPADIKPAPEPGSKKEASEKAPEAANPLSSPTMRR
ncbi:hypothetical protein V1283_003043 [Bradyrhizobium sp. AZCC 2262]|uniref:LapA family protein n=1 Tax=Bradyrhizobium sp. AZCC 2262 TaxID=3117022 RepID=UPI002FF19CD9